MSEEKRIIIPGLVLEGGAMRGMYTAGVLDYLMENEIGADEIVGVSAGALFGVNFLSDQMGRTIRYSKRFNGDKNYIGIIPLLKEGNIVSTEYAYERVPKILEPFDNKKYKASKSKFYAVVTNMMTGKAEYLQIKDVFEQIDVLRASGSMPFVSRPVIIDGNIYLDGAVGDSIPYEWMLNKGKEKIVVILTRDASYEKKAINPLMSGLYRKKYPLFSEQIAKRHILYNKQLHDLLNLEKEGKVFVIRPSKPINISRIERNPEILQAVYNLGLEDAKQSIKSLIKFLGE